MGYFFSKLLLNMFGWKGFGSFYDLKKAIIVVAPHTSLFDFVLGRLYLTYCRKNSGFLIKKAYFWFPLGVILRWAGAVPVDSSSKTKLVNSTIRELQKRESLFLVITPEGTRSKTTKWQKGCYYIASKAEVPILVGYIDYKNKKIGIVNIEQPGEDGNEFMERLKKYYIGINGRHPERFATGYEPEYQKAEALI